MNIENSPIDIRPTLNEFLIRFNEEYIDLAYYASFPLILTPELIGYLRARYLHDKVPWIAEIDLLLSNICKPISYEKYLIDPPIRNYLLAKAKENFGEERIREIAVLLIQYVKYLAQKDKYNPYEIQFQYWSSLVFLSEFKNKIVKDIARTFQNCLSSINHHNYKNILIQEDELYRLVKITEEIAPEISNYPQLLDYAKLVGKIIVDEELDELSQNTQFHNETEILGIILPSLNLIIPNYKTLNIYNSGNDNIWEEIERAFNENKPIKGYITQVVKGGLQVDLNGITAFLPGSLVDSAPVKNLHTFIGQEIEAKVIKFSRKLQNVILSRKAITDEKNSIEKINTLNQIKEGFVVEGTVKSLLEYGAFVDIGGIDGLLHVTDMAWGRLDKPWQMFKVGDHVQVKVLKLDREKEKISLGYKQLIPDPWAAVSELYPVGSRIKGKVSSVTDYGAFIELEPGVEGLVHVSEMSWSKRAKHPKDLVNPGEEVEVQVLGIDPQDRRISLSMKQMQPNPWDTVGDRLQVGSKVHGRVRNLTDFGAFIEVEDGVDGMVHVSDISWSKKIKHPKDALKKGQEVDAVVTNIDTRKRRLSLSIKELQPSAWESFVATHRPGDTVRGKISRFTNFGVFVELADEFEGLCHISELSDERVKNPEQVVKLGEEMEFKILRIEPDTQKIGLSHRAVGREGEPIFDTKVYTSETKGMASLGELANLKFGNLESEQPEQEAATQTKARKVESPQAEEPTE